MQWEVAEDAMVGDRLWPNGPRAPAAPLLDGMDIAARVALATDLEWLSLPGGAILFERNDPSDAYRRGAAAPHQHAHRRNRGEQVPALAAHRAPETQGQAAGRRAGRGRTASDQAAGRTTSVGLKQRLKPLVPPIALPLVRSLVRLGQRPQWQYVSDSWPADDPRSRGWQPPRVVEAQGGRWADFVAAIQSTRPLGVSHEAVRIESENPTAQSWLLAFAFVLARAAVTRDRLSVLDWGGGLGYYAVV